jgi:hypothetical protein
MSVDPNEIFLNDDQRRLLATAADEVGMPWQTLLNQVIVPLVHQPAPKDNGAAAHETAYDKLSRLGLIGCIEGTPPDLSTNKAYLAGLGRNGS